MTMPGVLDTGRSGSRASVRWGRSGITRSLGLSLGLGGIIMGLVAIPEIVQQGRTAPPWWPPLAAVLTFGMFPVLAVLSVRSSPAVIRAASGLAAVSFLAALAITPFAVRAHTVDGSSVWLYRMLPLGMIAAALAWPLMMSVGYLVIGATGVALTNVYLVERTTGLAAASDFARAFGLSTLFLWCVVCALRAGARVERESMVAARRAAVSAASAARDYERSRFAALIHDAVLSTLLEASRCAARDAAPSEPGEMVLRRQARATLDQLDDIRGDVRAPEVLDVPSAVVFLRGTVHEIDPGVRFATRTWPGFDDLRMPVAIAGTLAAALGEAVRNSLRHASNSGASDGPVHRTVVCTVSAGGVRLVCTDDGVGFDVRRVPPDRLGISVSILGRMQQLPGGAGFVESQPGEGTTVTLVWGGDATR
ncbi:sensor histidine kinase [Nocardia alni]|uniref:sensor histidine kinase n=1 Tax=Nocardia alni TaxID=2815723 RepID=UPI001C212258|nr:ATP-binding protein [Nocardia alni]